jgi:hypothetical protein
MQTKVTTYESQMEVKKVQEANENIAKNLYGLMAESKGELTRLRLKLAGSYWIIIILSVVMFLLGIVLLSVPIVKAFQGNNDALTSAVSAGFGIADLAALFLYGPIEKIHKMMGDMSQVILALNSYRSQVALRLLEMDIYDRDTIGKAAERINEAAQNSIKIIEDYFETVTNTK